jgi:hypothetical protein
MALAVAVAFAFSGREKATLRCRRRGLFYENFVLALLQSRTCVGWHWFKYQDNDPDDPHAEASNQFKQRYSRPFL